MKKFKKIISILAAAAMSSSMLVAPVSAAETTMYSFDFEQGTASTSNVASNNDMLNTNGAIKLEGGAAIQDNVGYGNTAGLVLNVDNDNAERSAIFMIDSTAVLNSGTYKLTYDLLPSKGTTMLYLSKDSVTWAGNTEVFSYNDLKREWYSVELSVDLDNDTAKVTLTNKTDASDTRTKSVAYADVLCSFILKQNVTKGTDNSSIFDNMVFSKVEAAPEPEPEPETGDFTIDFEGESVLATDYTKVGTIRGWGGATIMDSQGYNGTKGLVLNNDNGSAERSMELVVAKGEDKLTTGKYKLTYDFLPSTGTNELKLNRNEDSYSGVTTLFSYDAGALSREWHSVEVIIDLDGNTATAKITKKSDNSVVKTESITSYTDNLKCIVFKQNVTKGTSTSAIFDNMVFSKVTGNVEPDPEPEQEVLATFEGEKVNYGRTFENLTDAEIAAWRNDSQKWTGGFRTWVNEGVTTGYNGGKGFATCVENSTARSLQFYPTKTFTGLQHYRFDYKVGTSADKTHIITLRYATNGGAWNDAKAATFNVKAQNWGDIWVNVDIITDYDNNTYSITATPYDTSKTAYTASGTLDKTQTDTYGLYLYFDYSGSANATKTTAPVIDNFYWTTATQINVLRNAITITDKFGEKATDWNAVNPAVSSVAVNFGKDMDQSTLTTNTVKIQDKDGNDLVCTRSYANGVYTLTPSKTLLDGESTYKIVIGSGVKSAAGLDVKAVAYSFKTKKIETEISGGDSIADFDFDDCSSVSDLPQAQNFANETADNGWKTWGGNDIADGGRDGSGKAFKIGMASWTQRSAEYFFNSAVDSGKVKIEVSVKPSTAQTFTIGIFESARKSENAIFTAVSSTAAENKGGGKLLAGTNNWASSADYTDHTAASNWTEQWYDIEALLDLDAANMTVTVKSADSTVDFTGTYTLGITKLKGLQFNVEGAAGKGDVLIDNLKINRVYGTAPTLSANSFKVYADTEVQTNLNAVSSFTNKVTVDFGQSMKIADMSGANVYVTEKGKTDIVTTVDSYGDGVYTMVFADTLKAKTTYTVHVKPVHNVSGFATTEEYTFDFSVGEGTYKSELLQMIIGGQKVTKISDIKAGASQIEFNYFNSYGTAKTLYVIVAYYNDDALIKAEYVKYDVPESVTSGTYRADYTVPASIGAFDNVKVMSWDSFATMMPLGGYLEINN